MENATRIKRIDIACKVYKSKSFNDVEKNIIEKIIQKDDNEE